jgi:biotin---protein ligase
MNVIVYTGSSLLKQLTPTGPGAATSLVSNTLATLTPILSPFYSITTVSSAKLFLTNSWQSSTVLIIIPGGRDVPYCAALNGAPNAAITAWVRHRGGKFLGLCAGGYFGCRQCEFEVGSKELEVVGRRELGFFPGTGRGAAFDGFVYDCEDGARAATLKVDGKKLPGVPGEVKSYCNGGGIFVDAGDMEDKGVSVLARFSEEVKVEGGDAAIVYCKVGKGAAILAGVHPEYVLV